MCVPFRESPFAFPTRKEMVGVGQERVLYLPILGKRASKTWGIHVSASNSSLKFPMRAFAWDPNAVKGDHDRCLHMAPNTRAAMALSGYGDHTLAVIPSSNYWGYGSYGSGRCHHSDGAFSLFCVECEGYGMEETSLPDFWSREIPRGLVMAILEAAQQGAYVGEAVRTR